jgi:hypothetical protein
MPNQQMKTPPLKTVKSRPKRLNHQMCKKNKKNLLLCIPHDRVKVMATDRLEILKAKCEQEIQDAEENLRVLKAKLANLVSLAQESEKLANPKSEPNKYSESGFTKAVWDAIKALWEARKYPATTTEIKNFLLAHGFQAGENFDTAIYTVLARLHKGGKVVLVLKSIAPTRDATGKIIITPPKKLYRPK